MKTAASKANSEQARGSLRAAEQLAEWITSGRYTLNSQLPAERDLASMLHLSRSGLREALKRLEEEGRIWRRVGMGTFVGSRPRSTHCSPEALGSTTTLAEILEARSLIEPIVARLSAQRAGRSDIAMMDQYAAFARKAKTWGEWEKWDELLHAAIAEASGNGLMINTVSQLFEVKLHPRWTFRRATLFNPSLVMRYDAEHRAVIACIRTGDSEGAETAMRHHMLGLSATVGPTISNASPSV